MGNGCASGDPSRDWLHAAGAERALTLLGHQRWPLCQEKPTSGLLHVSAASDSVTTAGSCQQQNRSQHPPGRGLGTHLVSCEKSRGLSGPWAGGLPRGSQLLGELVTIPHTVPHGWRGGHDTPFPRNPVDFLCGKRSAECLVLRNIWRCHLVRGTRGHHGCVEGWPVTKGSCEVTGICSEMAGYACARASW